MRKFNVSFLHGEHVQRSGREYGSFLRTIEDAWRAGNTPKRKVDPRVQRDTKSLFAGRLIDAQLAVRGEDVSPSQL